MAAPAPGPDAGDAWHARRVLVFGGTGFIGTGLVRHLAQAQRCDEIVVVDIEPPAAALPGRARYLHHDVRQPIRGELAKLSADWIFNLAAVHREPGHASHEYHATNVLGADNVCAHASAIDCRGIFFTSSIACYGALDQARDESVPLTPSSPYGRSKQAAEQAHEAWLHAGRERRLIVVRPGAVYGPGDPGNILRMIRAVQRGWFVFAGNPDVKKSCSYVHELLASVDFMVARREPHLVYNLAEPDTPTMRQLVGTVADVLGCRARVVRLPRPLLVGAAYLAQWVSGGRSTLHPLRVRKSATPTHVVPARLMALGYRFRFDFRSALQHWRQVAPQDFA